MTIHRLSIASAAAACSTLLAVRPAFPCGSGDSSDSGSSSDSSRSSDSSYDGGYADDSSTEEGPTAPMRFPGWIGLEVGFSGHAFSLRGMDFTGTAEHDQPLAYRAAGSEVVADDRLTAFTADVRMRFSHAHVYGGMELQVGGASIDGLRLHRGMQIIEPRSAIYLGGGGFLGAETSLGRFRARVELFAGARVLAIPGESRYLDCVTPTNMTAEELLLEPRIGVETRLSPWATLGVTAGASDLRGGDVSAGFFLGLHGRED